MQAQGREPSLITLLFLKLEVCFIFYFILFFQIEPIFPDTFETKASKSRRRMAGPDRTEYYRGHLKYMGMDDGAPILTYLTCTIR